MAGIKAPPIFRISAIQFLLALVLTGIAALILGLVGAYSFFLGTLISILPNTYFATRVFRHAGARAVDKVLKGFYVGEIVKLAMMAAGFALAFSFVDPLNAMALFVGFIVIHTSWILSWVKMQKKLQEQE